MKQSRYFPLTEYLSQWQAGDQEALEKLVPLVFEQLHRIAELQFKKERNSHTLQPTALVAECYLRLQQTEPVWCGDRQHFFAVASRIMRRILVEHARANARDKRWGAATLVFVDLELLPEKQEGQGLDLLALDEALTRLAHIDACQASVVELRFFGGLSQKETADLMKVTERTVKRKWAAAKVWLFKQLAL